MNGPNYSHIGWLIALGLLGGACGGAVAPTPPTEFSCPESPRDSTLTEWMDVPAFVNCVVILSGFSEQDINDVAGAMNLKPAGPDNTDLGLEVQTPSDGTFYIELFRFDATLGTMQEAIQAIHQKAGDKDLVVFADADYLVGAPWPVEGSPSGPSGDLTDVDQYWNQWAFSQASITPSIRGSANPASVVILDTSPLDGPSSPIDPPTLYSLSALGDLSVPTLGDITKFAQGGGTHQQHGVAVAGLVRAASPASTLYLVRVLDGEARGDMLSLLSGLAWVINNRSDPNLTNLGLNLSQVVINMSLGFRPENASGAFVLPLDTEASQFLATRLSDPSCLEPDTTNQNATVPVMALCYLLDVTTDQGAVLVAAAGNGSAKFASPLGMNAPARWGDVIGVAASNTSGDLSCYSNQGEVSAPGGEFLDANGSCAPSCTGDSCIVVPQVEKDAGGHLLTVYRFWVGSSFAAPIVSGMVACLLESGYTGPEATARILSLFGGSVVDFASLPVVCFP